MAAIVVEFAFGVIGRTRDEALTLMDSISMAMQDQIGGAPWVAEIDSVEKRREATTLSNDQGFCYYGARKLAFNGPYVGIPGVSTHDGYKVQNTITEEGF